VDKKLAKVSPLIEKREQALLGGGTSRVDKQHVKGKCTARERLSALLDPDTFVEIGMFVTHRASGFGMEKNHPPGDGVVTGSGKIEGCNVYVYAQDFTILGGSLGEAHGKKIANVQNLAIQNGVPIIGLNDSGGARIQEGVDALAAYGDVFYRNVQASGIVPQISVILGPCAGGAVYSPAITDFVFMVEDIAYMFITGPQVIKAVTHEDVDLETLGGPGMHKSRSGVAHFVAPDEDAVFTMVRWLLSYLPPNNLTPPPYTPLGDDVQRATPELQEIVPQNPQVPYDVHQVIGVLVDNGEFLEVQPEFAQNLVIGFARMDGHSVGVIANQPEVLAGVIDIDAANKGARFIRFCDAFHIPLVTLVDTPGFLPGIDQEFGGIIRHGAKMLYAYAEATVPKTSLIMRKAYGGAYIVMSSKHLGGDVNLAWPHAEIAVMGPEGAVNVVFRHEILNAQDQTFTNADLIQHYREDLANPYVAASRGYIDDVIDYAETRVRFISALEILRDKRQTAQKRKHGNIPL
jgi:acetyl-CoA carboxylase carboxyltransferase component